MHHSTFICNVIFFTILAIGIVCILSCKPEGSNKPECNDQNVNASVRNFWDPTHYWLCETAGGEAKSVKCPDAQGFDADKGACVPFKEWKWTDPCPPEAKEAKETKETKEAKQ
ncbi:uncharacterized protein LOC111685195 isoform X1 [Lucilia cuprina]|uniref:uncharacterized protein LOC111685195 isoform X1 n=1 Tax=Lucilia cuprina TaxID=7375 RepID=UPI001F05DF76|nr:uncharacterized protein LOC111685195 isoform X1 [Lucilia cuprina]